MEPYQNIKREVGRGHPAAAPAPAAGPEAKEVTILMHLPHIRSPVPCIAPGPKIIWRGMKREQESEQQCPRLSTYGIWTKSFSYEHSDINSMDMVPLLHKPDVDLIIVDNPISGASENRLLDSPANYHLLPVLLGESFCLHPTSQGTAQVFRICDCWIQEFLLQQLKITYYYNICNKNATCCGMVLISSKTFPYFHKFSIIHMLSFKKK